MPTPPILFDTPSDILRLKAAFHGFTAQQRNIPNGGAVRQSGFSPRYFSVTDVPGAYEAACAGPSHDNLETQTALRPSRTSSVFCNAPDTRNHAFVSHTSSPRQYSANRRSFPKRSVFYVSVGETK